VLDGLELWLLENFVPRVIAFPVDGRRLILSLEPLLLVIELDIAEGPNSSVALFLESMRIGFSLVDLPFFFTSVK
jgi:hypothetical protein